LHAGTERDPIPTSNGAVDTPSLTGLDSLSAGHAGVVARITDDDPAFLSFLKNHRLLPGNSVRVLEANQIAQTMKVLVDRHEIVVSRLVAMKILVSAE
jgi:DtxR family Mn-dependent transcriptional regulator